MASLVRPRGLALADDLPFLAAITVAAAAGGGLLALSAYVVSPWALPALVVALAFVVVTAVRPAWALAGAFAAIPAESFGIEVGGLTPSEAALGVIGAGAACRVLLRPETVAQPQLRDAPVFLLLAAIGIGLTHAEEPFLIARVLVLWTLFYFVYLQVQAFKPEEMRLVVVAFAIGAAILGGLGAFDYLRSGEQTLFAGGEQTGARAASAFGDPNYYASALVLALLPALALAVAFPRRYWYLAGACAVIFAGIALSLSRGGLIAVVGGGLLLLASRQARWIAVGLAALFTVITIAGANPLTETKQFNVVEKRLGTLTRPGVEQRDPRSAIWEAARDVAASNPFFGVGVEQFRFEAQRRNLTQLGAPFENAHSIVFSLAAETGLIGLTAFLWFLAQIAARAVRALRSSDRLAYALALGLAAAVLGFALQGLTVVQIRVSFIAGAFFVIAGMLTALADRTEARA